MSPLGRIFVIGLFVGCLVGWLLQAFEVAKRVWSYIRQYRSRGLFRRMTVIALVIFGYFAMMTYRGIAGWRRTLGLLIVLILSIASFIYLVNLVSPKLCDRLIASLDFDPVVDDAQEGFITLFLLGLGAAFLTFLLFAPFGVLCATGLGRCGMK
jgi:hypothetical protein